MRETWYVLEDGSNADPREVEADEKGVLRHTSGAVVAMGEHGNPRSRSVEVEEETAKKPKKATKGSETAVEKDALGARDRQVKAEDDAGAKYKTR